MRIYLTFVLALTMLLVGGCETLNQFGLTRPSASLKQVQFGNVDLQAATLLFDVEVHNPYDVALGLVNLEYSLSSQKQSLFDGSAAMQQTIPARDKTTVTLPVTMSYREVAKAFSRLSSVRPGSVIPYDAIAHLSADAPVVGTLRLPLKRSGELKVPALDDAGTWQSILNAADYLR